MTTAQKITIFAKHSNGEEHQYKVLGETKKILSFIENYDGDDLGNDLIFESFVDDFEPTGVVIYPNK